MNEDSRAIMDIGTILGIGGIAVGAIAALIAKQQVAVAKAALKRKRPAFEVHPFHLPGSPEGWRAFRITARNLEGVSVSITAIRKKRRRSSICGLKAAMHEEAYFDYISPIIFPHKPDRLKGVARFRQEIPKCQTIEWSTTLSPQGIPRGRDSASIDILGMNITSASDLDFDWSWADGQRR
ncbi:hypothetical protein [Paracoccus sp. (in: a-proteobacteria)]|uniref:hypothetical protein n=1 Tax=Paracoccus sp. TaxID=267 RepID=UPI0028A7A7B5|nr:hypothetical protein [Paracoccus sp. (in: a-proteobacteria)]